MKKKIEEEKRKKKIIRKKVRLSHGEKKFYDKYIKVGKKFSQKKNKTTTHTKKYEGCNRKYKESQFETKI